MDLDDFEAGYAGTPTETPEQKQPEAEVEEAVEQKAEPTPDPLEEIRQLRSNVDKINGHIGGLIRKQNEFDARLAASLQATRTVDDAPTQAQVNAAASSPKEWEALKQEFPEWGNATEKLLDSRLATFKAPQVDQEAINRFVQEQTGSVRQQAINAALDNIVDGDWVETINSQAFAAWLDKQPDDVKSLGASDDLRDAAKMLRLFKRAPQEIKPKDNSRQKRIEAAVAPKGNSANPKGNSAMDEFESGFYS